MRHSDLEALALFYVKTKQPIPLDIAAALIEAGVIVEIFESSFSRKSLEN